MRDRLRLAVLVQLERLARKADREAALGIEHRRRYSDGINARSKHAIAALDLRRFCREGRDCQGGQAKDRDEPRGLHTIIVNLLPGCWSADSPATFRNVIQPAIW